MESIPHRVHFQELMEPQAPSTWNGREIQVYGFVHQTQEGGLILSSQATLKSCCYSKSLEQKTSILLAGQIPHPKQGQATLLQGTLLAYHSNEGIFWALQNPSVVEQPVLYSPTEWATVLLGIGVLTTLLVYFFNFRLKRHSTKS